MLVWALLLACAAAVAAEDAGFTNQWVAHIHGGEDVAQKVARDQGFEYKGPVLFDDHYLLTKPDHPEISTRDADHLTSALSQLDEVKWAEQQPLIQREKRGLIPQTDFEAFEDPHLEPRDMDFFSFLSSLQNQMNQGQDAQARDMDFFSFLSSLQSQGQQPTFSYGSGSSPSISLSSLFGSSSSNPSSGSSSYSPYKLPSGATYSTYTPGSDSSPYYKPSSSSSSKPSSSYSPSNLPSGAIFSTYTPGSGSSSYFMPSSGSSSSYKPSSASASAAKPGNFSTEPAPASNLDTYEGTTPSVGLVSRKQSRYASLFNDPLWTKQWGFQDYRTEDVPVMDHNVVPVWEQGITGKSVAVAVIDDGVEHGHPDLEGNFQADWSYNAIGDSAGSHPDPPVNGRANSHGTKCAGEIAMVANNNKCGVGVAYNSKIAGIKVLGAGATNLAEARALTHKVDTFDIYSNSWGPSDDGATMAPIARLGAKAIEEGITKGRNGKGAIYTFAGGNGRHNGDNCAADGYVNSPYVIGITSVSQQGKTVMYSERCTAIFAGTYSGGNQYDEQVTTIDVNGGCTSTFSGTSAACPVATGIIALALDANPNLTYRDVYHLIAMTSEVAPVANNDNIWYKNGRGFWVSNDFGFGLMNAANMVKAAKTWKTVPAKTVCTVKVPLSAAKQFSVGSPAKITLSTDACKGTKDAVNYLEQVELESTVSYGSNRGALSMTLKSPSGTKSNLLEVRKPDAARTGLKAWKIKTVHNWGEDPKGTWEIEVSANAIEGARSSSGAAEAFTFTFHGTSEAPSHYSNFPVREYSAFRLPNGQTS